VGYHYFIKKDGTIQPGRDLSTIGSHCRGYNLHSIGICLSGKYNFKEAQFEALRKLVDKLQHIAGGSLEVKGHCDLDTHKTCPNFNVQQVLNII
jgi:N-acetylmuramoyl-L-alanine amidase